MSNKENPTNLVFDEQKKCLETLFGHQRDLIFMRKALAQAQRAFLKDEVPVGAVVVDAQGTIIGQGYNRVETKRCQAAHAELHAIAQATKKLGNWRLTGCWLYVTLEPCIMCIGLIVNSRMAGVVYGASSPLFGFHLDNSIASWVYKKDDFRVIHHTIDEAVILLKDFFKKREQYNGSE